jgi:hypothetical protein
MPGYIKKVLQQYKHEMPKRLQRSPYPVAKIKYGKAAQDPILEDTTRDTSNEEILKVQQVVESILDYARAVDLTVLMSLSTVATEQAKAKVHTTKTMEQLLYYMVSNPDATMRSCRTSTQMPHTPQLEMEGAEHVTTSSWDGCQKLGKRLD